MEVVEDEHERPLCRGALRRNSAVASNRRKRAPSDSSRAARRRSGQELAQLGQELRELRGARAELRAQRSGSLVAHVGAQRLHPRPVGGRAARLPAAPDEHARAARPRARDQLLGEPALADPGLAGEQEEPPAPGERVVEARAQLGELALAADERACARPLRGSARARRRRSSAASWRRIACWSSRSSRPGSIPSSSTSACRAAW